MGERPASFEDIKNFEHSLEEKRPDLFLTDGGKLWEKGFEQAYVVASMENGGKRPTIEETLTTKKGLDKEFADFSISEEVSTIAKVLRNFLNRSNDGIAGPAMSPEAGLPAVQEDAPSVHTRPLDTPSVKVKERIIDL